MDLPFDEFEVYRMNLLAKAIKEIDNKLKVLPEEMRKDLSDAFDWEE